MERTEVLDMMSGLKLYRMRSAYDETLATALKRKHEPQRFLGDLLKAEIQRAADADQIVGRQRDVGVGAALVPAGDAFVAVEAERVRRREPHRHDRPLGGEPQSRHDRHVEIDFGLPATRFVVRGTRLLGVWTGSILQVARGVVGQFGPLNSARGRRASAGARFLSLPPSISLAATLRLKYD